MAEKSAPSYTRLKRSSTVSSSSSSSNFCTEDVTKHEPLLVCLLCCSSFIKPKLLDCQHCFCESCLGDYVDRNAPIINCPTCFLATEMPAEGLCQLKSSDENTKIQRKVSSVSDGGGTQRCDVCVYKRCVEQAVVFCYKCELNLCTVCQDIHDQQQIFQKHQSVAASSKDAAVLVCDAHFKMTAAWWCHDCQGQPVCSVCVIIKHDGHQVDKLHNALKLKRDNIKTLLKKMVPLLDGAEMALDAPRGQLKQKQSSLEKRINVIDSASITSSEEDDTKSWQSVIRYNRFFNMTRGMLDSSQSRKLIFLHDDVVSRLQTILTHELTSEPEKTSQSVHKEDDPEVTSGESGDIAEAVCLPPKAQLLFRPELIWKLEKRTSDVAELWNPCAVTFLPDGCTIVAEYDIINDKNNRLRVFSADGNQVSIIGQGKLRPLGVTVNKEGRIYATDCENKRVKIFSICGAMVGEIGKAQFGWPYGVAVNSKGQVIVSDAFNDTVSIFGGDGKRTNQIGFPRRADGHLRSPFHVAVDSQDNIYVADSGNHKVKVYSADGCYLRGSSFGRSHGEMSSERKKKMKCPRGVAVDMLGNLIVTDDLSRVALFNSEMLFQQNLLAYEDGVKFPEAIAANSDGMLAVTEWNPNHMFAVKVYKIYG